VAVGLCEPRRLHVLFTNFFLDDCSNSGYARLALLYCPIMPRLEISSASNV